MTPRITAGALALALILVLLAVLPATAQQQVDPTPVRLVLEELDAVLAADDPDGAVTAVLQLEAGRQDRTDLRLVTTVHTPVADRDVLADALGGQLGSVFSADATRLPDQAAGTARVVTTSTPGQALSLDDADRAGVYPLQYQIFQGSEPVGSVVSALVVLPDRGPAPLPATTVLRLDSPAAAPMDGDVARPALEGVIATGSPGQDLALEIGRMLDDGSAAGVAVVASGRLLADLAAMADGYRTAEGTVVDADDRAARRAGRAVDAVARLTRRADVELLAFPYGPADLVALVRGGRQDRAVELVAIGAERTGSALGTAVTAEILVPPDGLDAATLAAVGEVQADAVLMDPQYLSIAMPDALQPVRRLRTTDGGEVRMLVPDAHLSALLADPEDLGRAAVVQQLLAETALRWAGGEDPREVGVLLAVDPLVAEDPLLVAEVTEAIEAAPWLRPVNLSTLAARVRPAERPVRLSYPATSREAELDQGHIERFGQALTALGPLEALLPDGDPTASRLAESLLVAPSTAYRSVSGRPGADARIDRVLTALAALQESVQVVGSAPVTLTAATGEIPVTLVNTGDVAVRVRVRLASTRFAFPDGAVEDVDLPARTSAQLRVAATARNPGGFAAVTVTVTDPAGTATLTQTRLSVRSTAFPIVGVLALVGGGLVLLVWSVRQALRRRRPGRHEAGRTRDRTVA